MSCPTPFYVTKPSRNDGKMRVNYPNGVPTSDRIPVPCGSCWYCKRKRVDDWVFRCLMEERKCESSYFITLTYAPEHLPVSDNKFATLNLKGFGHVKKVSKSGEPIYSNYGTSLQAFWKRLRKLNKRPIKYLACGEYGSKTKRPHYHAILFNLEDDRYIAKAWSIYDKKSKSYNPIGHVDVDCVNRRSIAYVCKYIDKERQVGRFERDDRLKEFSVCSKGLGQCYLTPDVIKYHRRGFDKNFVTYPEGWRKSMPRYYRKQIWKTAEEQELMRNYIESRVYEKECRDRVIFDIKYRRIEYSFEDHVIHKRDCAQKKFLNRSIRARQKI